MMDITKRNKAQPSESPDATVQEEVIDEAVSLGFILNRYRT